MWTNLDKDSEGGLAALQIIRLLEIVAGYRRQHRDYSLASLAHATTSFASPTTTTSSLSLGVAGAGVGVGAGAGAGLSAALTSTASLSGMTPVPYKVPVTVLPPAADGGGSERVERRETTRPDVKRLRGSLEDDDA
ncbi:hypothetical protein BGX23_007547 [Mortierella sp. AD031]|nr:hypothetical protein BGX23_007547 [Mortierella sp. AD031]